MQVTTNADDSSSADSLFSKHKVDLIIWGKVKAGDVAELQIEIPRRPPDTIIIIAPNSLSDFLANRLQRYLIRAVANSYWDAFIVDDPTILAAGADQIEKFISKVDWSTEKPKDPDEEMQLLRDKIFLEAVAGQRMLDAALAFNDGDRAKRAVSHFERATAIRDGAGDIKNVISEDWRNSYNRSLLKDAQLNKTKMLAQLAASIYSKKYRDDAAMKNGGNSDLQKEADTAASAAWTLYSITKDEKTMKSARRLACESLLRWRGWQEYVEYRKRTPDTLAKKGLELGRLPKVPPAENTEAFGILLALQKDPSAILKVGSKIKELKDCESF
jgi:hypothetical protein